MSVTPAAPAIQRSSHWVEDGKDRLFTSVHRPYGDRIRRTGVVICNPIGHEYVHGFRTLRYLADQLAILGFCVARFDYAGTGNSSDFGDNPAYIDTWRQNTCRVADFMRSVHGVDDICVIGYRFGSSLATCVAAEEDVGRLVLWAPFVSSKRYLRELKALSLLADYEPSQTTQLEAAGFTYPDQLQAEISALDSSRESKHPSNIPTLVVGPDQRASNQQAARFAAATLVEQEGSEFESSMLEPHLATIPARTIESIAEWLGSSVPFIERTYSLPDNRASRCGATNTEEHIIDSSSSPCAGILSLPAGADSANLSVVILPNAGSVHNVGPNRTYVTLARALAQNGIACFRFDLPNLGESVVIDADSENHPYPAVAVDATSGVLQRLAKEPGFARYILAGLCSGAYTAFRTILSDESDLDLSLAMVNPLTFYWEDGMKLRLGAGQSALGDAKYYDRALTDPKAWKRFLSGESNIRAVFSSLGKRIANEIRHCCGMLLDALSIGPKPRLAQELLSITDRGIEISMFISSRDIGYDILRTEALTTVSKLQKSDKLRVKFIKDGDHTFTRSIERNLFVKAFVEYAVALRGRQAE